MEASIQHVWLLTGIINQCDMNPGRIVLTLGQVVETSLVKVTLLIAELIHPEALYSLVRSQEIFGRGHLQNPLLSPTPGTTTQ